MGDTPMAWNHFRHSLIILVVSLYSNFPISAQEPLPQQSPAVSQQPDTGSDKESQT